MSAYAWMITKDFIADTDEPEGTNLNAPGRIGPRGASDEMEASLKAGEGYRFRMYDGDDELYYEGRIVFDPELEAGEVEHREIEGFTSLVCCAGLPEEAFGPLRDFGAPNAGCTDIRYFDKQGRLGML